MSEEARKAAVEKYISDRSRRKLTTSIDQVEGFLDGLNSHASHTAAIREKAEALVAKHIEVCEADVFEMNFGDGTMMIGMSPKDIYQIGYAAALFGLGPELTALKAALEGKQ